MPRQLLHFKNIVEETGRGTHETKAKRRMPSPPITE
jgi:hypothetical protein